MNKPKLDPQYLEALRKLLKKIDPSGGKKWQLEIYEKRDGSNRLCLLIDIKSGAELSFKNKSTR